MSKTTKLTKKEKELYKKFATLCAMMAKQVDSREYSLTEISEGIRELEQFFKEKAT